MTRRIQASHFMHLGRQVELKLSRSATRMCGRRWASQWGMRAAWWRWSKPRPSRKELAFAGRRRPHQENHQQQAKLASAGLPPHPPSHRLPPLPRQPQRRNQDRMSQCRTCPACDFDRVGSQTERTLNSRCSSMVRTRKSASAMIHYTEFSALWNIRASDLRLLDSLSLDTALSIDLRSPAAEKAGGGVQPATSNCQDSLSPGSGCCRKPMV